VVVVVVVVVVAVVEVVLLDVVVVVEVVVGRGRARRVGRGLGKIECAAPFVSVDAGAAEISRPVVVAGVGG
jgi:hypothetical protein